MSNNFNVNQYEAIPQAFNSQFAPGTFPPQLQHVYFVRLPMQILVVIKQAPLAFCGCLVGSELSCALAPCHHHYYYFFFFVQPVLLQGDGMDNIPQCQETAVCPVHSIQSANKSLYTVKIEALLCLVTVFVLTIIFSLELLFKISEHFLLCDCAQALLFLQPLLYIGSVNIVLHCM